jgi:hypothetical protein
MTKPTNIENPVYYASFPIEPIAFILENRLGYCESNVVKYVCRYQYKHESKTDQINDLKKAKQYLDILIGRLEDDNKNKK